MELSKVVEVLGRKVADDIGDSTTQQLHTARRLYIAGAVGLGLSLASTAIFTGLLIHRLRKHPRQQAFTVSPSGTGLQIYFARSF